MASRRATSLNVLTAEAHRLLHQTKQKEKKKEQADHHLEETMNALLDKLEKLPTIGYTYTVEQHEDPTSSIVIVTISPHKSCAHTWSSVISNQQSQTEARGEFLQEILLLHEKNQKAMTLYQKYARDHCITSIEEHKKFLLLYERHAQTYGDNGELFLHRKKIELALKEREHVLATKGAQQRRMDIIIRQ